MKLPVRVKVVAGDEPLTVVWYPDRVELDGKLEVDPNIAKLDIQFQSDVRIEPQFDSVRRRMQRLSLDLSPIHWRIRQAKQAYRHYQNLAQNMVPSCVELTEPDWNQRILIQSTTHTIVKRAIAFAWYTQNYRAFQANLVSLFGAPFQGQDLIPAIERIALVEMFERIRPEWKVRQYYANEQLSPLFRLFGTPFLPWQGDLNERVSITWSGLYSGISQALDTSDPDLNHEPKGQHIGLCLVPSLPIHRQGSDLIVPVMSEPKSLLGEVARASLLPENHLLAVDIPVLDDVTIELPVFISDELDLGASAKTPEPLGITYDTIPARFRCQDPMQTRFALDRICTTEVTNPPPINGDVTNRKLLALVLTAIGMYHSDRTVGTLAGILAHTLLRTNISNRHVWSAFTVAGQSDPIPDRALNRSHPTLESYLRERFVVNSVLND